MLTNDSLQKKLDALDKSNEIINNNEESGTTRLQYNVHVFNNAVLSLQTELNEINRQLDESTINNEAILKLIQLKQVKANLTKVLHIFELVYNSISQDDELSFTVDKFQNALDELFASIKNQLDTSDKNVKLLAQIDKLLEMNGLFTHLSRFNTVFKKFLTKLSNEKEVYLNSKR